MINTQSLNNRKYAETEKCRQLRNIKDLGNMTNTKSSNNRTAVRSRRQAILFSSAIMCDKQHSFNKLSFVEFIVLCKSRGSRVKGMAAERQERGTTGLFSVFRDSNTLLDNALLFVPKETNDLLFDSQKFFSNDTVHVRSEKKSFLHIR